MIFAARPASVPGRMPREQEQTVIDDAAKRFAAKRQRAMATPVPFAAVKTLEQISPVVETRVTSPVRRCGSGQPIASKYWRDSLPNPAGISSAVVSN